MKILKLLVILQLVCLVSYGQDKALSPNIQSRTTNSTGVVNSLTFKQDHQPRVDQAQSVLINYLGASKDIQFIKIKTEQDQLGFIHDKYQQYYKSVPIEFAMYKTHAKDGQIQSINGEYYALKDLPISPSYDATTAITKAKAIVNAKQYIDKTMDASDAHDIGYEGPNPTLVIFPQIEGLNASARLAYKLDIYASDPLYRADVYIDANTGVLIYENNKIHHTNVSASGVSLYDGTVNFSADLNNNSYRLRQTVDGNGIQTYSLNNGTSYNNATDITSTSSTFSNKQTGVQAHYGAEKTHQYYMQKHNRNSYNGNGAIIKSYVSYSNNYVNAFWNGSVMTYGDGNGTTYAPLVSLDIVGHEITHGVTTNSANLVYSSQSGALNESFSDIFGEMIEHYGKNTNDWLMGSEIGIGQNGAFRSMSNPKAYGDPDTYLGQYWATSSADNYGVHTNSGVQNKWFYILSIGETGTNDNNDNYAVTGIGIDKASAIAYRNLTVYLSSNSNYAAARTGAIQSAIDLYGQGSPEVIATTDAWYAVGVGSSYGPPPPPPTLSCVDGNVTLTLKLDNYPSETSWNIKDGSNTIVAQGSGYNVQGATITATATLAPGNYTFNIYDSYGDGICCAYGNGYYNLTSDTLIATGGAFGSSETTAFCVDSVAPAPDTTPPTNPTNLASSNITQTTVDLSWNASTDNVGVVLYNIYQNSVLIGTSTTTNYSVSNLMASTTYSFTVAALDAANNISGLSNIETITTLNSPDITPPTDPTNLTSANTTQNTTDLSWNASTDNVGVVLYNIYQNGNLIGTSTTLNYAVSGLAPSTSYAFTVAALDAANNISGLSNIETVTTQAFIDIIPPTDPTNLASSNTTQTTTDLNWTASTDNVGVTSYTIYEGGNVIGTSFVNSYQVTNLSAASTYSFYVRANDAANNQSGNSNTVQVLTLPMPDTTPPTDPTNLTSSNTTQTSTDLNWTASTDNVAVVLYNIYQNGILNGYSFTPNYTVVGLSPNTTYNFTVEAVDGSNNVSGLSNIETVTTLPSTGSTTVLNQGYFESGWDGWTDGGSDCHRFASSYSYEGNFSVRLRDNSGNASSMNSPYLDLTPYDNVEVSFYFYPRSMENGEDFWLRYSSGGNSWTTLATYTSGPSFQNNNFYTATVVIPTSAVNFSNNARFRFQCDASANNDEVYIDQVTIKGIIGDGGGNITNTVSALGGFGIVDVEELDKPDGIYPNPADDKIYLDIVDPNTRYKIYDMGGKLVLQGEFNENGSIEVGNLGSGFYFLKVIDEEVETYKFIKK